MSITYIKRIEGSTNNFVFLWSSDSTATCLGSNYILNQAANIAAINFSEASNPFQWFINDMVLLSASDGLSLCSINSTFTTLSLIASEVIPLPVSVTNGITAHATGGQTNAVVLTSQLNRVTTVASPGDSIALPVAAPGLSITVINNGANPMQVYGNPSNTDTINGQTSTVGVSQLPNSVVRYVSAVSGLWQSQDIIEGYADGNLPIHSFASGLTAHAGGMQTSALQLTAYYNNVTTVATAADSVKLPASVAGLEVIVSNSAASNAMQVFGLGTDTINSVAAATGVSQPAGTTMRYVCYSAGNWIANLVPASTNLMLLNAANALTGSGSISLVKGTGTEASNAVTVNNQAGVITTSSLTTAGGSSYAITFTNSFITSSSVVLLTIMGGTNTTENITLKATSGSGTSTLTIYNNTAATALNGTILIGFSVF
jgi:hypothetical protein